MSQSHFRCLLLIACLAGALLVPQSAVRAQPKPGEGDPDLAPVPLAPPLPAAEEKPTPPPSETKELDLSGLEKRADELKEKVSQTKARILQLRKAVVSGANGAGARSLIVHRNEMGGFFKLISVQYTLDTAPIYKKVYDVDERGDLNGIEEREIDCRNIAPGNHNILVRMVFQGAGYGIFSYVKGYKFKMTSSYTFTIEEGKNVTIKVVSFEQGGITTKLQERPAIRYDVQAENLTSGRARTQQEKTEEAG